MNFKQAVEQLLNEVFEEHPQLFLIDFSISGTNKITVVIDGDEGVNLQDCINVSRHIEHNLDREKEDFSLEVSSAGISSALVNPRQFKKNIGRTLKIKLQSEEKIEADVVSVTEDAVELSWKSREPKKVGKGKETVTHQRVIPIKDIKEAFVKIKFN